MQIYLDFSAYCDMAIGISLMFGIRLPINFLSPYKAESIIDFWRRWHITLSRFLRDYIYIPLGGNRQGALRRYGNLIATMVAGGIWHGASWTFLVWGTLHGLYLLVNHAWREFAPAALVESQNYGLRFIKWGLTFTCVVVAWVFFRADSLTAAGNMLRGMFNPAAVGPLSWMLLVKGFLLLVAFFVVMVAPNAYEVAARWRPGLWERLRPVQSRLIRWRPEPRWAVAAALLAVFGSLRADKILHFLYFNF
jgi:D-alanyl-lipoteichoic acid acyltransferase DltB (MBOAT superfamily)